MLERILKIFTRFSSLLARITCPLSISGLYITFKNLICSSLGTYIFLSYKNASKELFKGIGILLVVVTDIFSSLIFILKCIGSISLITSAL